MPYGHPIGVDIGLSKFLATSDGVIVKPPKFFTQRQSELKLLSEFAGIAVFPQNSRATQIE